MGTSSHPSSVSGPQGCCKSTVGVPVVCGRKRGRYTMHSRATDAQFRLRGVMRGKLVRTRSAMPRPHARWTGSTGSSERSGRTSCRSSTSRMSTQLGWLYVAFVSDVFARPVVGWCVQFNACGTELDELKHAFYARQPEHDGRLLCHSDRTS